MRLRRWHRTPLVLLVAGHLLLVAYPVEGGPLRDCLFGSSSPEVPSVSAYALPTTTYYAGPPSYAVSASRMPGPTITAGYGSCGQTAGVGQTAYSAYCSPTVVYQPPAAVCCPTPVVAAPRTYYRTTWKRVPVTRYEPTTAADPITGCPVTVMKPCTTYTWQPVRRRCGLLARLLGLCDSVPAVPVNVAYPSYVSSPAPCIVEPGCGVTGLPDAGTGAFPPDSGAPYYDPGPVPATPTPGSLAPASPPTLEPRTVPGGASEAPEPADTRPSLLPGTPGSGSASGSPSPNVDNPTRSSSRTSETSTRKADLGRFRPDMAPARPSGPTVPLPSTGQATTPPKETPKPAPVPGPDATPTRRDENSTPELLNPQDRVTSRHAQPAWAHTAISWPRPRSAPTRDDEPVTQRSHAPVDDSGWYSIAP